MPSSTTRVACAISANRLQLASEFARIVRACAQDLGQKISVRTSVITTRGRRRAEPVLTLHLPAELAAAQHPVWCLACRLACFCPTARVSVFVHGENAFRAAPTPAVTSRRRAA
jgi:hypothetical protein